MSALCLGAGNITTQHAEWHHCVNIGSCTTRVFVTTCLFTFAISPWTWNWRREQTSNSAWNSANLERRLWKWYDVRVETKPWGVWGFSSGTRASREAEHHLKTRGQGDLPWAQHLTMWKQFGGLCTRIVGEPLRTLLQSLMCHTIVNVSHGTVQTILTCDLNMHRVAAKFIRRLLTPEQKEQRVAICQELHQRAVDDPSFMSRVITGDESCGSVGMIPKLNNSLHNGGAQHPQDQRRRGSATARPRTCLSCFSTFEGLCTMNLSLKARLWTHGSTAMFFAVWGKTFGENDLNCGARTIGCSVMTVHALTELL
jgi:hypothetical protein